MVVTQSGIVIRTPISEIKIAGRNTQGVKIIAVDEKTKVASIAIIPHSDVEEDEEEGEEVIDETTEPEETAATEKVVRPDEVE